ncbi:hypothetical protein CES85_5671 [Ochrobactrum quorumnocens]|uniref:Uncharacterized protein n=1 Tax=Ochrobactrum quorumnocens TaxID=271865 RepID=A0A248UDG7_9HYPH|nr:hypothetical protein CES85_5671 [[Ochrobactrum] quorumnocens]
MLWTENGVPANAATFQSKVLMGAFVGNREYALGGSAQQNRRPKRIDSFVRSYRKICLIENAEKLSH